MKDFFQGDVIKIKGFSNLFIITSKNAFIKKLKAFHVCPVIERTVEGPLHIAVSGKEIKGIVICEQVKLIDPQSREIIKVDHIPYRQVMEISDVLQGIFEYD